MPLNKKPAPHARAISLILALSVMLAGYVLIKLDAPSGKPPIESSPERAAPASSTPQNQAAESPVPDPAEEHSTPESPRSIFTCRENGRVSLSDQPCFASAQTLARTVAEPILAPALSPTRLEQMRAAADAMQAARLNRERQWAALNAEAPRARDEQSQFKQTRCREIDREINAIDAHTRQRHSAREGNYWRGERKKLNDERYSLGC